MTPEELEEHYQDILGERAAISDLTDYKLCFVESDRPESTQELQLDPRVLEGLAAFDIPESQQEWIKSPNMWIFCDDGDEFVGVHTHRRPSPVIKRYDPAEMRLRPLMEYHFMRQPTFEPVYVLGTEQIDAKMCDTPTLATVRIRYDGEGEGGQGKQVLAFTVEELQ